MVLARLARDQNTHTAAHDRIFANPGEPKGLYVADLRF
jgi:hypothetical protein